MIIIWGIRRALKALGVMSYHCSCCGQSTVHTAYRHSSQFTLFFIPLIPLGSDYTIMCLTCGMRLKAVNILRKQLADWGRTGQLCTPEADKSASYQAA